MPRRFPLPQKPSPIVDTFEKLCEACPIDELPKLRHQVQAAVDRFAGFRNDLLGPSVETSRELAARCGLLLDRYEKLAPRQRALAVGAVRYFITQLDAISDQTPIVGFNDDIVVMNHVLEQLNISGHFLQY